MVGMLDWVRELAENGGEAGTMAAGSANGYYSLALAARKAVFAKRARRSSMTMNGALMQVIPIPSVALYRNVWHHSCCLIVF